VSKEASLLNDLLGVAFICWALAAALALTRRQLMAARVLLVAGCIAGIVTAILGIPNGTMSGVLPTQIAGETIEYRLTADALWLMGFGLAPAALACALATPSAQGQAGWLFGAAMSLMGAMGVFGIQNGAALLIAWEIMSFGGAVMILSERLSKDNGRAVLFMLGLLEVGALALVVAILLLERTGGSFAFESFREAAPTLPHAVGLIVGIALLIGFGAKLGLLPFYEWFPAVYGAGSGASGALMSGIVLNAAFFALSRGLLDWIPDYPGHPAAGLGMLVLIIAVLTSILAALYAFQGEDWRVLLSLSSAENAAIAVAMLGAALMFRADGLRELAGLAWTVALLHLAGHALAKGAMLLSADGVYRVTGRYAIAHTDLLRNSSPVFGIGVLFATMSLAAMPPQAGFISEWFMFQTLFQGFHLDTLAGRLVMALSGAGLALTVAVGFATFIKVFGIGLLGRTKLADVSMPARSGFAVGLLGLCLIALAIGMPLWLDAFSIVVSQEFQTAAADHMHDGLLLVPLTARFAFISPTLLVVVMPLLALIPIILVAATQRMPIRRVAVWYGGFDHDPDRASTTALTFSNAMRRFYSFVYRPTEEVEREATGATDYFVHRLVFTHDVAPIFGPYVFRPVTTAVLRAAEKLKALQSGHLNFYLALIGGLLVLILALTLT
jgi:hydrogenase-4 component B